MAVVVALLLLAPGAQVHAQLGIGQVNGTVFGPDRKGVPGLPVAVVPLGGGALYGTSTDSDGRYAIKGMPPGTYSVVLGLPDGAVRKDGIRIRPLFRSIVDFTLGGERVAATLPPLRGGADVSKPAAAAVAAGIVTPVEAPTEAPPAPPASPAPPEGPSPAAIESGPAQDGTDGSAAAAPAAELALTWTLQGPEKASAPDAWVAAIPVKGAGALRRGRTDAEGGARLTEVAAGSYGLLVRAPGFMTWRMGPLPVDGSGEIHIALTLVPFPMGFEGTLEDLLIPADPIPLTPAPAASPR